MSHNVRCYTKLSIVVKILKDGLAWLKTSEGWIVEKIYGAGVSRILAPTIHGQPVGAKVVTTKFEQNGSNQITRDTRSKSTPNYNEESERVSTTGWSMFSSPSKKPKSSFTTKFIIDVTYPENALIKISRSYEELKSLYMTLTNYSDRMVKDRATKAGDFPLIEDGNEDNLMDINQLLYVIEGVETWLFKLLTSIPIEKTKCNELIEFLTPTDSDFLLMEVELMASGGIGGTWADSEELQV